MDRLSQNKRSPQRALEDERSLASSDDDTRDITRVEDSFNGPRADVVDLTGAQDDGAVAPSSTNGRSANKTVPIPASDSPRTPTTTKRKHIGDGFGRSKRGKHDRSTLDIHSDSAAMAEVIDDVHAIKRTTRSSPLKASTPPSCLARARSSHTQLNEEQEDDTMMKRTHTGRYERSPSPRGSKRVRSAPQDQPDPPSVRRLRSGKISSSALLRPPADVTAGLSFDAGVVPETRRRSSKRTIVGSSARAGSSRPPVSSSKGSAHRSAPRLSGPAPTAETTNVVEAEHSHALAVLRELRNSKLDSSPRRPIPFNATILARVSDSDTEMADASDTYSVMPMELEGSITPRAAPSRMEDASLLHELQTPTPQSILTQLQTVLESVRGVDLQGTAELRQVDDLMFEIRKEAFRSQRSTQ